MIDFTFEVGGEVTGGKDKRRSKREGKMAVTHADIEIHGRGRKLGSKAGTAVIVLCIFCGILGFVFSVFAECWKTKVSLFLKFRISCKI